MQLCNNILNKTMKMNEAMCVISLTICQVLEGITVNKSTQNLARLSSHVLFSPLDRASPDQSG